MTNEDQGYSGMHIVKKTLENDDSMGCFWAHCSFKDVYDFKTEFKTETYVEIL